MITLQITQEIDNPEYKSYNGAYHYDTRTDEQKVRTIKEKILTTKITEKQFDSIRKEIIKNF